VVQKKINRKEKYEEKKESKKKYKYHNWDSTENREKK
jgi:hypothetical protein